MLSLEKAVLLEVGLGVSLGGLLLSELELELPPSIDPIPDTLLLQGKQLAALKLAAAAGSPKAHAAVEAIRIAADRVVDAPLLAVTDKVQHASEADPHRYFSLAKYWWPNPDSADGLPYVRRDGEVNPECYSGRFDYLRLVEFSERVLLLSLAGYLCTDAKYAQSARAQLCHWLLDEQTRQAPEFATAQIVPGHDQLTWAGIVEARFLNYVTEAIRLLATDKYLSDSEHAGFKAWFDQLLDWLSGSRSGQLAAEAGNNIVLWYDLQRYIYGRFCDRPQAFTDAILAEIRRNLTAQIDQGGALPRELERNRPLDYLAFTIAAMALITRAADSDAAGIWSRLDGDSRSFAVVKDWLASTAGTLAPSPFLTEAATAGGMPAGAQGYDLDLGLAHRMAQLVFATETQRTIEATERAVAAEERARVLQDRIDHLETQLAKDAETRVGQSRFDAERAVYEAEKQAREDQIRALVDYVVRLEARASAIVSSRSWALTRPVRLARRKLAGQRLSHSSGGLLPKRPSSMGRLFDDFNVADPLLNQQLAAAKAPRGLNGLRRLLRGLIARSPRAIVARVADLQPRRDPLQTLLQAQPQGETALRAEYEAKGLATEPDTFVLYRIVGNDLYPRHKVGQSRENVQFILDHEPTLPDCEKRWVLNRIIDPDEEAAVLRLLEERGQSYLRIPFDFAEYREVGWDFECLPTPDFLNSPAFEQLGPEAQDRARTAIYRLKNNYAMNNNGARNVALEDGRDRAKWVLPWDGNCFVTEEGWRELELAVKRQPHLKYFVVPMQRITENSLLLAEGFPVHPVEEPQMLFRRDAAELFNPEYPYGRRSKVELFWRLGVPGPWDYWGNDPWDLPRPDLSPEAHAFGVAGWVARLNSGVAAAEQQNREGGRNRRMVRQDAIIQTIDRLDGLSRARASHESSLQEL